MGAWIETLDTSSVPPEAEVAPLVGAWIETSYSLVRTRSPWSHPSWVRGLKLLIGQPQQMNRNVAPLVGAWIETNIFEYLLLLIKVAPLVGAWIETNFLINAIM